MVLLSVTEVALDGWLKGKKKKRLKFISVSELCFWFNNLCLEK